MLKYRADKAERQLDDALVWRSQFWDTIAKIENCRTNLAGDPRVTAFVQGEPDTFFSIPAVCSYRGCRVTGYLTRDDDGFIFRHCYY